MSIPSVLFSLHWPTPESVFVARSIVDESTDVGRCLAKHQLAAALKTTLGPETTDRLRYNAMLTSDDRTRIHAAVTLGLPALRSAVTQCIDPGRWRISAWFSRVFSQKFLEQTQQQRPVYR